MYSKRYELVPRWVNVFHTPTHDSCGALWFNVGRPRVRPLVRPSFMSPNDSLNDCWWIFTKLGVWDLVWDGQISLVFDRVICPLTFFLFFFSDNNLIKYQWNITKLGICIDLWTSGLDLQLGIFRQFSIVIYPWQIIGGVLSFHVFILKGLGVQKSNQKGTKIVSLIKMADKVSGVSIHLKCIYFLYIQ